MTIVHMHTSKKFRHTKAFYAYVRRKIKIYKIGKVTYCMETGVTGKNRRF
jgi:hypothetical protein